MSNKERATARTKRRAEATVRKAQPLVAEASNDIVVPSALLENLRAYCDEQSVSIKAVIAYTAAIVAWSFSGCGGSFAAIGCVALEEWGEGQSALDSVETIILKGGQTCLHGVQDFERIVRAGQAAIGITIAPASDDSVPILVQLSFGQKCEGPVSCTSGTSEGIWINAHPETGRFEIDLAGEVADRQGVLSSFLPTMNFVMGQIVSQSGVVLDDLELVPANSRQMLFETIWNMSSVEREGRTLFEAFEAAVARFADRPAVSFGAKTLSYAEFFNQVVSYSDTLAARGVGKGSVVAVSFERSFELIIAVFAVLRLEAVYLPIDPKLPQARKKYILSDSGAELLLTPKEYAEVLDWARDEETASAGKMLDGIAYIIYTSGSTGAPKGVMIDHPGILNRIAWAQSQHTLKPGDVLLQKTNIMFDVSVWELFGWFTGGAAIHLLDPGSESNPQELIKIIRQKKVTVLHFVPTMLGAFLEHIARAGQINDLPLRRIHASGEALQPHHVEGVFSLFGGRERIELVNLYGPTEASVDVSFHDCDPSDAVRASIPIGKPIHNTGLYVLDARRKMLPPNVAGELYISGDGVGRGYVNLERLSGERFCEDPYRPGKRMYATGDRALWQSDGTLKYLGRFDHQIKLRGFRIELTEIELAMSQLDSVSGAVAGIVKDRSGDDRLVAFVVPQGDARIDSMSLRRALGQKLPDYMIPERFVFLDAFPVGRSGKTDRSILPNPFADVRAPLADGGSRSGRLERAPLVRQIVEVWQEILEVEDIADTQAFFDAGGNSMKALRVASRIESRFGVEISVTSVFQYPTPIGYAEFLERVLSGHSTEGQPSGTNSTRAQSHTDIAIIGMSGRLPGAPNIEAFRHNIARGIESVRQLSDEELLASGVPRAEFENARYIKAKGVLDNADQFDAAFFGYSPREAERMDPQIRLLHEVVWAALEDAGEIPDAGVHRIGLFASAAPNFHWLQMVMPSARSMSESYQLWLLNEKDFLTTRVAHKLNFKGPCVTVQTACSSSLAAVHYAKQALLDGNCEMAVAAGVCLTYPLICGYLAEEGMILSQDGHCRAFDAHATGTVGGNGVAAIVLKPLKKALDDGDVIRAVIKGSAINNDGADKAGFSAPSVAGQARAIRDAIDQAGFSSRTIRYVEAHGTGTALGDPIEVEALKLAFDADQTQYCGLGSVKANIGHLDAAAGIAGIINAVHVIELRQISPSANFALENKALRLHQSPFYITRYPVRPELADTPFRAGVSAFGMGGTNVHVVLEESPERELSTESGASWTLLPMTAKSPEALRAVERQLADRLETEASASLVDIAWTLQTGRRHFGFRDFIVARSLTAAIVRLQAKLDTPESVSRIKPVKLGKRNRTAFVFTGQGGHYDGMGRQLYLANETFRHHIDDCGKLLAELCDFDLAPFFAGRADRDANWTERTEAVQPVLFTFEYALSKVLREWGVHPDILTGHSLGEIVAACEAGVFSLPDALQFVCARGRLMGEGAPGKMLSVRLPSEELVLRLPGDLDIAAVNESRTTVVSGAPGSIEAFRSSLAAEGIESRILQSEFAFHSRQVDPMLDELRRVASSFDLSRPERDLVSTATGALLSADDATDPEYWVQQARHPVMFADAIDTVIGMDADVILEVGPGQALKNLILRDRRDIAELKIENTCPGEGDVGGEQAYLLAKAGELWKFGLDIDWNKLCRSDRRRKVSLPTYPFESKRFWPTMISDNSAAKPSRQLDIDDWFYFASWQSGPLLQPPAQSRSLWLVLADAEGKDQPLIEAMTDAGQDITIVYPGQTYTRRTDGNYEVDPTDADHFGEVLRDLASRRRLPNRILHLWCLEDSPPVSEASGVIDKGYRALLGLGRALGSHTWANKLKLLIVADQVERIMDADPVHPAKAAMYGFSKIIPLENAAVWCRLIDCGALATAPKKLARVILAETADEQNEPVAVYRSRDRWLKRYRAVKAAAFDPSKQSIRPGGIYLITGGLGGMGLALATAIAAVEPVTLVLASRRAFPDRQEWADLLSSSGAAPDLVRQIEAVQHIEMLGSKVVIAKCDVSIAAQIQSLVADIHASYGDINGVVHAAGLADYEGMIQRRDWTATEAVLAPKVQGTLNIKKHVPAPELDFVVLCSSIGNIIHEMKIGQSGYNAANEFLDACARAFNSDEVAWQSLNWTDWKGVGMTQAAIDYWAHQASTNLSMLDEVLRDAIDASEGGLVFLKALKLTGSQIIVSETNLSRRGEYVRSLLSMRLPSDQGLNTAGPLSKAAFESAEALTEWLSKRWTDQFGVEKVDVEANFFDAGATSLDLVQLHSRCCDQLGIDLPLVSLYDYPTLAALADHLFSALSEDGEVAIQEKTLELAQARKGARERVKSVAKKLGR